MSVDTETGAAAAGGVATAVLAVWARLKGKDTLIREVLSEMKGLRSEVGDVRERLARIEGRIGD